MAGTWKACWKTPRAAVALRHRSPDRLQHAQDHRHHRAGAQLDPLGWRFIRSRPCPRNETGENGRPRHAHGLLRDHDWHAGRRLDGSSASPFPSYLFNNPNCPAAPAGATDRSLCRHHGLAHGAGGWVIPILVGLHAAAALKHQFLNRDNLLGRMIPFLKG